MSTEHMDIFTSSLIISSLHASHSRILYSLYVQYLGLRERNDLATSTLLVAVS
jgi:hypothetical protein